MNSTDQAVAFPQRSSSTGIIASATLVVCMTVVALGASGPNLDLALMSALTLMIGVACLWRTGEAPTLLFIFLLQWLQASAAIFQSTLVGKSVDQFYDTGPVGEATILTLLALIALAVGLRVGAGGVKEDVLHHARQVSVNRPMSGWFKLYAAAWICGAAAMYAVQFAGPLAQILLGVNAIRWAFFFMLAYVHFSRRTRTGAWFPVAFLFELATSLGGFFSDFKTVFIITFLALMMAGVRLTAQRLMAAALVAVAAFGLGVVWTAVKGDYRGYVSGGQAQAVNVDYSERITKLAELVSNLDQKQLGQATEDLLARLSYVEYFGATIAHVPASVPHEGGALLLDAFTRPFMPRVLFQEKTIIDDSQRTRFYTGRTVAGAEAGTSISIGWAGETYIDFGRWGMMVAAIGIGLFYGLIQRVLTRWKRSRGLLGYAAASSILVSAAMLESSITKVVGGVVAALLVTFFVIRFVIPALCPWIVRPQGAR